MRHGFRIFTFLKKNKPKPWIRSIYISVVRLESPEQVNPITQANKERKDAGLSCWSYLFIWLLKPQMGTMHWLSWTRSVLFGGGVEKVPPSSCAATMFSPLSLLPSNLFCYLSWLKYLLRIHFLWWQQLLFGYSSMVFYASNRPILSEK